MKGLLTKNILLMVIIVLVVGSLFSLYNVDTTEVTDIGVQQLVQEIKDEQIDKVIISGNEVSVTLKDSSLQKLKKENMQSFSELLAPYDLSADKMTTFSLEVTADSAWEIALKSMGSWLLLFFLFGGLIWFMTRQLQAVSNKSMSFGQSRARETKPGGKPTVTFKDVAGVKEAKQELLEVVEFLKSPKKFLALGAKPPKGVLLMGSPGTGKTLLAKAVAGEAGVPFYSISGSEFVEMFVGIGASRVRDLFMKAKKSAPSIIFIDEIDAVGRQRGAGLGGSHDEREQTLNQILTEMDGFEPHTNVIVIAATNRPDVLDPALLRPGRFDRRVQVDLPDINDREQILKIYARNKPFEKDVNLRQVAERTPGFSGADLENLLNEAAILSAQHNLKKINNTQVLESIEKVMLGPERRSYIMSGEEKRITAYHEAGHALVAHMQVNTDPVHKISIISRGRAAGYTLKLPDQEKKMHRRSEYIEDLAVLLAGHVTEKNVFGEVTTGASNDLQKATQIARQLITQFGMSNKLAPRIYGEKEEMVFLGRDFNEKRNYSEKVAEKIDEEIDEMIETAVITAKDIITKHRDKLDLIVDVLLKQETIERKEFEDIMGPKPEKKIVIKKTEEKK